MNFKYKIVLFVVCLVALLATQSKIIMPWVYSVVAGDLFLKDTDDPASERPINNEMSEAAFKQCNHYIQEEAGEKLALSFVATPINAWGLGDYHYLINSELTARGEKAPEGVLRYACRIKYDNGNDKAGINEFDNWSLEGVSGLDEIGVD